MAQTLGESLPGQYKMIHAANPQAEVFMWFDRLDPNHNAHKKYHLVDGSFEGTWNYIAKDIEVACLYY